MIKRNILIAFSFIALLTTLSLGVRADGHKIVLVVGTWAEEPLTPYVEHWSKETGVEVEIQAFPFRDLLATLEVRGNAKADDLDAVFVDAPLVPSYAVRGLIGSMDTYFTDDEITSLYAPAGIDAGSWNGDMYAPPLNNSGQITYYNKDLLSKAGCAEPSIIESERITWEEVVDCAKKIADPASGTWGLIFDQVSRYYQLQALGESLGGGSGVCEGGLSVKGCLTNDGWNKAAQWYYDTHNTWNISPKGASPDQTHEMFGAGKIGIFVGGSWNNGRWKDSDLNYGLALHPYFEGGKVVTGCNSWHIGVWNYSKHKDDAASLTRYLTASPDVAIMYVNSHDSLPAHNAAIQYVAEDPKFDNFPNTSMKLATYESANHCSTRGRTPGFLEFEEIVNTSFEDIRNGGDPVSVMQGAETRIESAMRRYQ